MSTLQWIGFVGGGVFLLLLVAVIGTVRLCLQVEDESADELASPSPADARPPRLMHHSENPS